VPVPWHGLGQKRQNVVKVDDLALGWGLREGILLLFYFFEGAEG